ncbi:hypothetical protein V8G54_012660 [Vigna mungo]|uniref:Uncharacterized protein n=1 Tax=Vigna mungo TaxID=3915 RepID=A0AAQ3S485_VIGMU
MAGYALVVASTALQSQLLWVPPYHHKFRNTERRRGNTYRTKTPNSIGEVEAHYTMTNFGRRNFPSETAPRRTTVIPLRNLFNRLERPVFFSRFRQLVEFRGFWFCEEERIQEGSRARLRSGVNGCEAKKRLEFSMMTGALSSDRRGWWRVDLASYGNANRDIEQALIALKKGAQLLKYGRKGKPKFCPFRLSSVGQPANPIKYGLTHKTQITNMRGAGLTVLIWVRGGPGRANTNCYP